MSEPNDYSAPEETEEPEAQPFEEDEGGGDPESTDLGEVPEDAPVEPASEGGDALDHDEADEA